MYDDNVKVQICILVLKVIYVYLLYQAPLKIVLLKEIIFHSFKIHYIHHRHFIQGALIADWNF